jgi:hypothetical protein
MILSSSRGGLIDSSGATLGAVPAINTTRQLTADGQIYFSNGTNWYPFAYPGWPRRDGTDDEEWESADANPPTGWTWDNQASTTDNENGTRSSFLVLTKPTDQNGHSVLYKNVPASPNNKTYMGCFQVASDLTSLGNNHQAGLALRNNTNGRIVAFTVASAPNLTLFVANWTTTISFSTTPFTATGIPLIGYGDYIVLGIQFDGTNLSFRYSSYAGGAESNFVQVFTATVASFLTSFDAWGITIFKNAGTLNTSFCDWLRVF